MTRCIRAVRGSLATALALALGGCATDLRIGVDTDADTVGDTGAPASVDGGPDGGPDGDGAGSSADASTSTSTTQPVDPTTGVGSTAGGETGEGATGEPGTESGEPSTESGAETTSDPTGDPPEPCIAESQRQCLEDPICTWVGEPGECAIDPCKNPKNECLELDFEPCVDAPSCAWVGEPELGECGSLACVPCEALGPKQCARVEGCEYDEGEMVCVAI